MRYSLNALLSLIFLGIHSTFANACVLNHPRYRLTSDTVQWELQLSSGEKCVRGVRFNNVAVDKLKIVSAPQIGHVTLEGTGFSYKATKNFHGSDFFSLIVSGTTNKVPGNSMIEVEVSASGASELRPISTTISPSRQTSPPFLASPGTSSPLPPPPVDGLCGSSNNVAASNAPTINLCSTGAATAVSRNETRRRSCTSGNGSTTAPCSALAQTAGSVQKPGPSVDLFTNPYYTCVNSYYVSTSGSDFNNGSLNSPWRTLQHADFTPRAPGDCINVAPGTYNGFVVHNGGNAATATGYVVYRCEQMDACTITGTASHNSNISISLDPTNVSASRPNTVNYVQFDGFNLTAKGTPSAQGAYGVGFAAYNCNLTGACNTAAVASHHIWLLNSIISGFDQGGVSVGAGDYFYVIHNTAYNNALTQCDAQGSGISIFVNHDIPGYVPTADDQVPYSGFGFPTWELGDGTFFHVVIAYNVTYNNYMSGCGAGKVTDSNGIIFDTNAMPGGNSTDYHDPMLAYGNVSYNNGGGGVHVFKSYNVTVANNTSFNNYIDSEEMGGPGMIDDNYGGNNDKGVIYHNYYYNNIAVACTSAFPNPPLGGNNAIQLNPTTGDDPAQGNVTYMVTTSSKCGPEVRMLNAQTYSSETNHMQANPLWVNVPFTEPGTGSTPPRSVNFALSAGSPAIGYGITKPYLPSSSVDAGACPSTLTTCP